MIAQLSARNRSDYFRITFEMILSFESKNRWRRKKFCSWKGRRQDGTINPIGSNICIGLSSKWARSASLTLRRSFDKAYTLGEGEEGGGVESSPRFQNLNLAASLLFAPSTLDRFPFDDAPPLVIRPGVPGISWNFISFVRRVYKAENTTKVFRKCFATLCRPCFAK